MADASVKMRFQIFDKSFNSIQEPQLDAVTSYFGV